MSKALKLAITKALELPEPAQEHIGRELLERIANLDDLRKELALGLDELQGGLGEKLDIEEVIQSARAAHGDGK